MRKWAKRSLNKFASDKPLNAFGRKFTVRLSGDNFRFRATAIVIAILFSHAALADFDFAVSSTVRSYPLSGVIESDAGYGFLLWGDQSSSPWYGYLRPRVNGATAITYNSGLAALDFYPLSFLGGSVGSESVENDSNYTAYDCSSYICKGRFYRNFVQTDLTLGWGPLFAQARWRRERWINGSSGGTAKRFIEPTAGLALGSAGDSETIYRGLIGYKFDDNWSLTGVFCYAQSDSNNGISRFPFAVVRYTDGPFSLGVGGGVFSSQLKGESGSALLFVRWNVLPSLELQ